MKLSSQADRGGITKVDPKEVSSKGFLSKLRRVIGSKVAAVLFSMQLSGAYMAGCEESVHEEYDKVCGPYDFEGEMGCADSCYPIGIRCYSCYEDKPCDVIELPIEDICNSESGLPVCPDGSGSDFQNVICESIPGKQCSEKLYNDFLNCSEGDIPVGIECETGREFFEECPFFDEDISTTWLYSDDYSALCRDGKKSDAYVCAPKGSPIEDIPECNQDEIAKNLCGDNGVPVLNCADGSQVELKFCDKKSQADECIKKGPVEKRRFECKK